MKKLILISDLKKFMLENKNISLIISVLIFFILICGCETQEVDSKINPVTSPPTTQILSTNPSDNSYVRLPNGQIVAGDNPEVSMCRVEYNSNHLTDDAVIVFDKIFYNERWKEDLTPVRGHEGSFAVFVQPHQSGNIRGFENAIYDVYLITGKNWDINNRTFTINPRYFKLNTPMNFSQGTSTTSSGNYKYHSTRFVVYKNFILINPDFATIDKSDFIDLKQIKNQTELERENLGKFLQDLT